VRYSIIALFVVACGSKPDPSDAAFCVSANNLLSVFRVDIEMTRRALARGDGCAEAERTYQTINDGLFGFREGSYAFRDHAAVQRLFAALAPDLPSRDLLRITCGATTGDPEPDEKPRIEAALVRIDASLARGIAACAE
jgi:hypothetical protein